MVRQVAKSPQLHNPITHGCVLYLPLWHNELAGSPFSSCDDFRHVCTVTGALVGSNGRIFDGTDDKITIPDTASLNPVNALTLEAWIYHNASALEGFLGKRIEGSDDAYQFFVNADDTVQFSFFVGNIQKKVDSAATISNTTWTHIVGTYDKVKIRVYIDGVIDVNTTNLTGSIDITTDSVSIGWAYSNTYAWNGLIGEARIYNRALSAGEITDLFNQTKWRYL